jgi:hypothetical protein
MTFFKATDGKMKNGEISAIKPAANPRSKRIYLGAIPPVSGQCGILRFPVE